MKDGVIRKLRRNLKVLYVPVVSKTGKPLMPCTTYRANELIKKGKALRRFNRGLFYVKLTEREDGITQPIAIGIDPGSKKEGFTVKSNKHTFLNIQADAVTWVKLAEETSTLSRKSRRARNCPCRKSRLNNKSKSFLAPSTRARWNSKLRIAIKLCKYYPVTNFVVEDISARTKPGQKRWNTSFSPLEIGKKYFYLELSKLAPVTLKKGWETKAERDRLGLQKSKNKFDNSFEAHCVDSWVLANLITGGHISPENKNITFMIPLKFHRRQLHALQPSKGGIRREYGGTLSLGLKRGSWVRHLKYNICYVGRTSKNRITLHEIKTGKRLARNVKPEDCIFLTRSSWRVW